MAALSAAIAPLERLDGCRYCAKHPDRKGCAYCTRRRRTAGQLADQGLSAEQIASRMGITERWAGALVAAEYSIRECEALRCDKVPVEIVLAVLERWQQRAPEYNTWSELARRVRYRSEITLRRALGDAAKDGRKRTKIDVELAGRVVRAMGYAPCEFDWL